MSCISLLKSTLLSDLPTIKNIITINSNEAPYSSFKKLCDHSILSAPVVENNKFIGFIDLKDLVQYIIYDIETRVINKEHTTKDRMKATFPAYLKEEGFINIAMYGAAKMYKEPALDLSYKHQNAYIYSHHNLYDVCAFLAKGINRVAVLDNDNHVINIISQSTIIHFLNQHSAKFGNDLDIPYKLSNKPVITVNENVSALDTLRVMSKNNISGVPIISDSGEWIATTTGSDLRLYVHHPSLAALQQPIAAFLSDIRQQDLGNIKNPTISVPENTTWSHVIAKLAATRIHRLFVVDHSHHPIDVISLTDILRHILPDAVNAPLQSLH